MPKMELYAAVYTDMEIFPGYITKKSVTQYIDRLAEY